MPRHCVAAGCDTISCMGYSLHSFPKDNTMRRKWTSAVKRQRVNSASPSTSCLLCSKHFKEDCFVTEGVRYRDELGVPAQNHLKPDAVPTIFARSTNHQDTGSNTSTSFGCPLSERSEQKLISLYVTCMHNI